MNNLMDKRERARLFRDRLSEAIALSARSRSAIAAAASIDRSALSQLLRTAGTTLPNGETLARLSTVLGVSCDWLLGVSSQPGHASTILEQAVRVAPAKLLPADQDIIDWHLEVLGQKIRYVPSSLPTAMKTDAVMKFEFRGVALKNPDQAIADATEKLSLLRRPESEFEIAMSVQTLQEFAEGGGIWRGLDRRVRRRQIEALARYCDELYPGVRLHLYDGCALYSAPLTVFGHTRAILYLGQRYLVFPQGDRVIALIQHFDELVRAATVTSSDVATWLDALSRRT